MSAELVETDAPRCPECGMPLSMHHNPGCRRPCWACEAVDRAAWLEGVRQRLQLVTIDGGMPPGPEVWPSPPPGVSWFEYVHGLEVRPGDEIEELPHGFGRLPVIRPAESHAASGH